ncbi:hypothetical protein C8R45DRAFT_349449 [Mycena sanguinolenta]|nr:hypothetical protein C8R45DRAFT_349449 [Mycena sanguinolenta]
MTRQMPARASYLTAQLDASSALVRVRVQIRTRTHTRARTSLSACIALDVRVDLRRRLAKRTRTRGASSGRVARAIRHRDELREVSFAHQDKDHILDLASLRPPTRRGTCCRERGRHGLRDVNTRELLTVTADSTRDADAGSPSMIAHIELRAGMSCADHKKGRGRLKSTT